MDYLAAIIALTIFIAVMNYVMGDENSIIPVRYFKPLVSALVASGIIYGLTELQPELIQNKYNLTDMISLAWVLIALMFLADSVVGLANTMKDYGKNRRTK